MCAIAGIISSLPLRDRLIALRDKMTHRGPDDAGAFITQAGHSHLGLGHRRLAIRDLSEWGAQPLTDPSKRWTLVYNGEIYNHRELRSQLEELGVMDFRGSSDTEVLLRAWSEWGEKTLEKLQGEFAFALWDAKEKKLFLCRDRLGIKPLFYSKNPSEFAFASELRALFYLGFVGPQLNPEAIDGFLTFGSVPEPLTIFHGGSLLEAGTYLIVDPQTLSTSQHRYWKNPFRLNYQSDVQELTSLVKDAVQCRLVSDVPLGVFLSGGLDSSMIVAAAEAPALKTLCLTTDAREDADPQAARIVAKTFRTQHSEPYIGESKFSSHLATAMGALDQPSIDGLNTYFISKAARESGLTVALSGVGADEIFVGYRFAQQARWLSLARTLPLLATAGTSRRQKKLNQFFRGPRDRASYYAAARSIFLDSDKQSLILSPMRTGREWVHSLVPWIESISDNINAICALDIEIYLRNTLLRDTDSASMACSLEVRGPFLDHRFVEWAARVPGPAKLSFRMNKPLLARALGSQLPAVIRRRKKKGFTLPWNQWLRASIQDRFDSTFSSDFASTWAALGIEQTAVQTLYRDFSKGNPSVIWAQVWSLFMLADWHQTYAQSRFGIAKKSALDL